MDERVLKEGTCLSLSGRSTLAYQVGAVGKAVHLRLTANSGGGHYSREWVPLHAVLDLLGEAEEPFAWDVLQPLFEGKSVNTACFLMAALKNEGLVRHPEGNPRHYERGDSGGFLKEMEEKMSKEKPKRPRKEKKAESAPEETEQPEERSPT